MATEAHLCLPSSAFSFSLFTFPFYFLPFPKPPISPKLSIIMTLRITNKANFPKSQMNVNKALTKDYEKRALGQRGKNKANSKPNKANFSAPGLFYLSKPLEFSIYC
jgi:hypothetical protein